MWLTFRSGARSGEWVEVTGEEFVLGRAAEADLTLDDARVSRRHAKLTPGPGGTCALEDLGSGNGTFLNGVRLTGPALLRGGEQLQLGDTVLGTAAAAPAEDGGTIVGTQIGLTASAAHRVAVQRSVRRTQLLAAGAALVVLAVAVYVLAVAGGEDGPDPSEVVARVAPSVVFVQALDRGAAVENGTGWVLDASGGLVVTNAHVVNGGRDFAVGGAPATLVGVAPCEDLAVLKVGTIPRARALPLAPADAKQGQDVLAVGFPAGASRTANLTATRGSVSVARTSYDDPAPDVPRYPAVVQTDAAINPGSSGGPLVDLQGRLVGVNAANRTQTADGRAVQGQGFAIGVERVRAVVARLRAGAKPGWAGVGLGWSTPERAPVVTSVVPGGPAEGTALGEVGTEVRAIGDVEQDGTLSAWCRGMSQVRGGTAVFEVRPNGGGTRDIARVRVRVEPAAAG